MSNRGKFCVGFFTALAFFGWIGAAQAILKGDGTFAGTYAGTGIFDAITLDSTNADVKLVRDAANVLAQRNGTNAQSFLVYNTFTDASNYERAFFRWSGANTLRIGNEVLGTGTSRSIVFDIAGSAGSFLFNTNGGTKWTIQQAGGLTAGTDNSWDIGAAGATRPRTVYTGTSFIGPLFRSDNAKVLLQGTGSGATQVATTQTTVPTCTTNCGTPGNVCVGTDTAMICTMGTTPASGFVINFNATWAAIPSCVGQAALAGMATGKKPLTVVPSTTIITVTTDGTAPVAGDKYAIHCIGVQ